MNDPCKHWAIRSIGPEFKESLLKAVDEVVCLDRPVLTVTSDPTRTNPVKRGNGFLKIFDAPPPEPPPNVPQLAEGDSAQLTGSLREQMEKHRSDPACASCHKMMDPLGFGLENYDAIGAWRDRDGTVEIDATGELPTGQTFDGPHELRRLLLERRDDFRRCISEKMLTFALGRGLEYYDACALERLVNRQKRDDDRFAVMVEEIVKALHFDSANLEEPMRNQLSRRTVLRGAGVSIALPLLEAMAPVSVQAATGYGRKKNHCGWHLYMHPTASI